MTDDDEPRGWRGEEKNARSRPTRGASDLSGVLRALHLAPARWCVDLAPPPFSPPAGQPLPPSWSASVAEKKKSTCASSISHHSRGVVVLCRRNRPLASPHRLHESDVTMPRDMTGTTRRGSAAGEPLTHHSPRSLCDDGVFDVTSAPSPRARLTTF